MFKFIWFIKNPTLRAVRLKIIYKDVFSIEIGFRFQMTDSPSCEICGLDETVEHQLFSCRNAQCIWETFYKITGVRTGSLYEVLCCSNNLEIEIVKSTLIKALIQINRSSNRTERDLIAECSYFLGIEARVNVRLALRLRLFARRIMDIR